MVDVSFVVLFCVCVGCVVFMLFGFDVICVV